MVCVVYSGHQETKFCHWQVTAQVVKQASQRDCGDAHNLHKLFKSWLDRVGYEYSSKKSTKNWNFG